ncbi:hypothetical protein MBEHAL_0636 [Halarchaeum acidiphilum MH1-52-1]|uniref:Uncharacterized protein n=1 Tax=Halarchaeum acidiphilum MH1-52-1 TaxID=1261545 RepID=U2YDV6_9EURY|nr:hypothetical protein [Halarchaeum acidiphilum]GAD51876.1 hypothetical protein MBEHAL_0636 [Halarchaeum acidiphilum MH1-52-1]
MDESVRAGVAAFDSGEYAAARDVWREAGGDIADDLGDAAAVIVRGRAASVDGLAADVRAAGEALSGFDGKRGVSVADLRGYLETAADDPAVLERRRPPALTVDGEPIALDDLAIEEVFALAPALADAVGGERERIEKAVEYARADLDESGTSAFVTLCYDVVTDPEARPIAYQRLVERVDRRETRETDVEGLFG